MRRAASVSIRPAPAPASARAASEKNASTSSSPTSACSRGRDGVCMIMLPRSDSFEGDGNALPHADAHGGERPPFARELQLQGRRAGDARAGHAERMAERDGAAVRVDVLRILRDAELAQNRDALAGESLVQLHHIEIRGLQPETGAQLP